LTICLSTLRDEVPRPSRHAKGRLVYMQADVTDQIGMWDKLAKIGEIEGRLDVAVANAGILEGFEALDYPALNFKKVCGVCLFFW